MEAEKKLRQSEAGPAPTEHRPKEEDSKVDHLVTPKKHSDVAMIKLRMPNGKVSHYCLINNVLTSVCRYLHWS